MLSNQASRTDGVADARAVAAPNAPSRIPPPSRIQLLARDLPTCRSPEEMRTWLQGFAQSLGFYGGRYVHLGHLLGAARHSAGERPVRVLSTTMRDTDGDGGAGALVADPVVVRARDAFLPFSWSTQPAEGLTDRQSTWLKAERARGVGAGVAMPIQDYAAGPAYLSLFGVDAATAEQLVLGWSPDLAFVAAQFHARAQQILPAAEVVNAHAALTPREIECLRLSAVGRTVSAIAADLGITGRTVEFHLANAAGKISAVNKVHAVAIAASMHLIRI